MTEPLIDVNDLRQRGDRYARIDDMRAASRYARTAEGGVVFFNQADAVEVLRCENFRFAFNQIDAARSPYLANAIRHELLNMHGHQHNRLSRLVKMALRDRIIEGLSDRIQDIVRTLLDNFPDNGEVEFCTAFADPLPARVLGPMFGVPYEDTDGLNDWIRVGGRKVDALQSGVDIAEVEDANRKIHDYLRRLLIRKNASDDDLFSELMRAEIDGDRMSADELVYLASELASAGVDTTRAQLPLILHALLTHPDEMAKLQADPKLALRAVDEGMRWAPLPWALPHTATRDHDYNGITFATGDLAYVLVPAANRDPSVVPDPHAFNITRERVRNFAFGHGMHGCPGAQLARMEMAAALRLLVERCSKIELSADPVWEPGNTGRTLDTLHLQVSR